MECGPNAYFSCDVTVFPMDNDFNQSKPDPTPMSAQQGQLTMSLLNNLLQMQGLENAIMNQQQSTATATTTTTATIPSPSASPQQQPTSPTSSQLLLEQQIKLTQLRQLQQLQNQIFQQQVVILNTFIPFAVLIPH